MIDIDSLHSYGLDLKSNHIFLTGDESYVQGAGYDYAQEPGVEYVMASKFIRNIHLCMRVNSRKPIVIHLKTCFSRKTMISTVNGYKKICDIKVGDEVLTHQNRYRKVTDVMSSFYEGDMVRLFYGRNKHNCTSVTATADHPILVEREGQKQWVEFKNIVEGDVIFVESGICEQTGERVPYWKRKKNHNCDRLRRKKTGSQQSHLENDILPFCEKLKNDGWSVVPVGGGVMPDIIGFKDGKIVAFEVEKMTGKSLEVKKEKYEGAIILDYVDEVVWETCNKNPKNTQYCWYEVDESTGFAKVKVTSTFTRKNQYKQKVYNLTVEEDNSYLANKVVVHNCGGLWEEGMAIYDAIKGCPNHVTILSYTHARSMSSLIFLAGDKRVMMPHSCFMLHDGTYTIDGTVKLVNSNIDFANKTTYPQMMNIYASIMQQEGIYKGQPKAKLIKHLRGLMDKKEDVFFTPEQAIEYGFAHEIFTSWNDFKP